MLVESDSFATKAECSKLIGSGGHVPLVRYLQDLFDPLCLRQESFHFTHMIRFHALLTPERSKAIDLRQKKKKKERVHNFDHLSPLAASISGEFMGGSSSVSTSYGYSSSSSQSTISGYAHRVRGPPGCLSFFLSICFLFLFLSPFPLSPFIFL